MKDETLEVIIDEVLIESYYDGEDVVVENIEKVKKNIDEIIKKEG